MGKGGFLGGRASPLWVGSLSFQGSLVLPLVRRGGPRFGGRFRGSAAIARAGFREGRCHCQVLYARRV